MRCRSVDVVGGGIGIVVVIGIVIGIGIGIVIGIGRVDGGNSDVRKLIRDRVVGLDSRLSCVDEVWTGDLAIGHGYGRDIVDGGCSVVIGGVQVQIRLLLCRRSVLGLGLRFSLPLQSTLLP